MFVMDVMDPQDLVVNVGWTDWTTLTSRGTRPCWGDPRTTGREKRDKFEVYLDLLVHPGLV